MKYREPFNPYDNQLYDELDNRAWDIFIIKPLTKNVEYTFKQYFVYNKYTLPYCQCYEQAKIQLRRDKLIKIKKCM